MDTNENVNVKFCPDCGNPVKPGAKFCVNCGWKVVAPEKSAPKAPAQAPEAVQAPVQAEPEAAVIPPAGDSGIPDIPDIAPDAPEAAPVQAPEAGRMSDGAPRQAAFVNTVNTRERVASSYDNEIRNYNERREAYANRTYVPENTGSRQGKGLPGWATALIISGTAILIIGILFLVGFLGYHAINAGVNRNNSNSSATAPDDRTTQKQDTVVGDQTVPGGSNVTINVTGDSEEHAAAVYAKCKDSVVGIVILGKSSSSPWSESSYQILSEGSGVVYSTKGYIITNAHVISMTLDKNNKLQSDYQIRVYVDQSLSTYYEADVMGIDYTSDLAVLKINAKDLVPAEFEYSSTVKIGDKVFVLGCPGGVEFLGALTSGIVGGLNKNLLTSDGYAYDLIQTDAAINPGNSGGAMVNSEGKLIGICEMKIVESGYEGMGFAIASDTVKEVCDALIRYGKYTRPAIGIQINTAYDAMSASDAGLPAGAWIAEVKEDSVAGKAGLKKGMIITEFNGVAVYNFVSLRAEIMKCQINDEVTIKAYVFDNNDKANGTYKTFTLKLQSMEDEHREFD